MKSIVNILKQNNPEIFFLLFAELYHFMSWCHHECDYELCNGPTDACFYTKHIKLNQISMHEWLSYDLKKS